MLISRSLIFIFLVFNTTCLLAQPTLIIPQRYDDKLEGKKIMQDIEFIVTPYVSNNIDLKKLKGKHPQAAIPNQIEIKAPFLENYKNVVTLLALFQDDVNHKEYLVLWLAGNYNSNKVTFFIDRNMDGDFRNDKKPIVIQAGQDPKKIELTPKEKNAQPFVLWINVPWQPDLVELKLNKLKGVRAKIEYNFTGGILAGFSVGSIEYNYDNLVTGFPTWYSVNMVETSIGASLGYTIPKFRFEILGIYQAINYYTSYLNIRVDEPEFKLDPSTGKEILINNVDIRRNLDTHPKSRMQIAATVAYRLHIGSYTEIQPYISGGNLFFLPSGYTVLRQREMETFNHKSAPFLETGLRVEFTTGMYRAFFIETGISKTWWKPDGFFESVPHEQLETKFINWKMSLGYRMAIGKLGFPKLNYPPF